MTGTVSAPGEVSPRFPATGLRTVAVPSAGLRLAHAATLVAAVAFWGYLDRSLWFFGDEWDFLTRRGLHGARFSIWAPHNEHWSVLPILLWRALYSVWHLSSYWPYLVPLLLAHVAVVDLVWRRCLREGAAPSLASLLTLLLALYGAGAEDLAWAFQIGFVGSLALGLAALQVVDGGRAAVPGSARGAAGALLALGAMMCSGVGVAMTVALAVALWARSGYRRAAAVVGLPLAAYAVWFVLAGRAGLAATGDVLTLATVTKAPVFVAHNIVVAFDHGAGLPVVLGRVLALGTVAWCAVRARYLVHQHPAVVGCLAGALVFYSMAALGRDRISALMSPSRYAYIGTALFIPAVSLALSRWPDLVQRLSERRWEHAVAVDELGALAGHPAPARRGAAGSWLSGYPLGRTGRTGGARRSAHEPPFDSLARGRGARSAIAALAVGLGLAVVANVMSAEQFTSNRTRFVKGLEAQVLTTARLLQVPRQMALAVDRYPIWASGAAAGYLTPRELGRLYRTHVLPSPPARLWTPGQLRGDETWLDVVAGTRPLYRGGVLLGLTRHKAPGLAVQWRRPPGPVHPGARSCALASLAPARGGLLREPPGRRPGAGARGVMGSSRPAVLALTSATSGGRTSVWLSLGPRGGRAHVLLLHAWGALPSGPHGQSTWENVVVPPAGHTWLSDSVPGDGLLLGLAPGQRAEICGIGPGPG